MPGTAAGRRALVPAALRGAAHRLGLVTPSRAGNVGAIKHGLENTRRLTTPLTSAHSGVRELSWVMTYIVKRATVQ